MVRLVVADGEVAFDLAGGSFGRGAHVHARPDCLAKAPRGIARSFKCGITADAPELGRLLAAACERRLAGLLLAARRSRALVVGADAVAETLRREPALVLVAVDAGGVATTHEVQRAAAEGRAIAWKTKNELGALLGEKAIAICAIRHAGIANELKTLRAAADAGAATTREGAECSIVPEAR
jgi:ribosomal protein L7Ae-like RNA K-turn-binding protein